MSGDGQRLTTPGVLDAPDDSGPEAGPVGYDPARAWAQGPLEQSAHSSKRLGFPLTGVAPGQMSGCGLCGCAFESPIEVGADPAAGPETGQHDHWTAPPTTRILMPE